MTREELITFMKETRGRGAWHFVTESRKELNGTDIEDAVIEQLEQQPCEDCISREAVIKTIKEMSNANPSYTHTCDVVDRQDLIDSIDDLPSVTPKYTDEEIDKIQAVEQAYVDKMVELAVEESRREWLNSFDTNSATKCFEAVNILKERLEHEETKEAD